MNQIQVFPNLWVIYLDMCKNTCHHLKRWQKNKPFCILNYCDKIGGCGDDGKFVFAVNKVCYPKLFLWKKLNVYIFLNFSSI